MSTKFRPIVQFVRDLFRPGRPKRHTNAAPLTVEQLGARIVPAAGPRVLTAAFGNGVLGSATGLFNQVQFAFDTGVRRGSVGLDDITVSGPDGKVTLTTVDAEEGSDQSFIVRFSTQSKLGTYTFTVGPDIVNPAGKLMDQNNNDVAGEAGVDAFTATQTLTAPATFAVGGADGSVRLINAVTKNTVVPNFRPLDVGGKAYTGILQIVQADFNGDRTPDLFVAAASPAGVSGLDASKAGRVFVFDGTQVTAAKALDPIHVFRPFTSTDGPAGTSGDYVNGLNIAVADVDGDGKLNLVAGTRGAGADGGKKEYGRVSVVGTGANADGSDDIVVATTKPFGNAYEKGVVVAAGDADGDKSAEIAVTRGGPVAATNPNKTVKLKVYQFSKSNFVELNLTGGATGGAFAPFGFVTNASKAVIERDARVAFVDPDNDGKQDLVFSALDRITDPANTQIRVGVYSINTTSGAATLVSTGATGTAPATYVLGQGVLDHAITGIDVLRDGSSKLAIVVQAAASSVQVVNPLTGNIAFPSITLTVADGGLSLGGF